MSMMSCKRCATAPRRLRSTSATPLFQNAQEQNFMPLPQLPTRMGAMVSTDALTKAAVAPAPAAAAGKPAAKHEQASPAPAGKAALPTPAPEVPALADGTSRASETTPLAIGKRKLCGLDYNVLLPDSNSLFKFEEHDIFLPMMVLEELDHQKKGMSDVARNARQFSRFLDG